MSDSMKLSIDGTIKEGVTFGIKNIGPVLVNVILWVLTVWIPYINVGTSIGLFVGIVSKVSKGETIPMTEIFDPKYRKYMGEYFLTAGLMCMGVFVGACFFFIPGIVIGLAWSLALLLVIDKGKNPAEALTISNNCTYGNKWRMVGIYLLLSIAFSIVMSIISGIAAGLLSVVPYGIIGILGFIFFLIYLGLSVFYMLFYIGIQASIYKQLTANV